MALAANVPKNTRRLVDAGLSVTVALPVGTNTVNSNWINMAQPGAQAAYWNNQAPSGVGQSAPTGSNTQPFGPYAATERVFVNVVWTASTNGNNGAGSNISVTLQHAPVLSNGAVDSTNAANIPWRQNATTNGILGLTNGAVAAGNQIDTLPPWVNQFIRVQAVGGANMNNAADANITVQLLF